jgi:cytochrome c-type biogenesis protein CcmH
VRPLALLALAWLCAGTAATSHAARIRPVSTSSSVAASHTRVDSSHAARIRPVSTSSSVAASHTRVDSSHAARIRPVSTSSSVAASQGWSSELERELMSPYCPGRSLIECPSPQATELRLWIQAQERAGVPRSDVEARLVEEFGDMLRHSPRAEGWGLWAYLVPVLALLAGGALVFGFLRRQAGAAAPAPAAAPYDAELAREVERELGAS